jgi:hypothetical protein
MELLKYLDAGAHESISPGNTATGITAAIKFPTSGRYKGKSAMAALITIEDENARLCMDGTTPTNASGDSSDVGHKIESGQNYPILGEKAVADFKIIDAVSGSNAVVKVTTFFEKR